MMTMQPQRWATAENDPHGALAAFQESLPVDLIATARRDFSCCRPGETIAAIIERNNADRYDFLPVFESEADGETVVGVLEVTQVQGKVEPEATVRQYMQPLAEQHLVGADAGILTFIRDADRHPFRFVVSGHQINGLVTLSDLQRLPVRAALFAIVTHLEMTMTDVIRRRFPQPDDWMTLLSQGRAEKVQQNVAKAKLEDTLVDWLLYTEFYDKVKIIAKDWPFQSELVKSKASFSDDMDDIQKLRDNLAHANDYAASWDAARHVCECVRKMDDWISALIRWREGHIQTEPQKLQERD